MKRIARLAVIALIGASPGVKAQKSAPEPVNSLSFADTADLALAAPIVAEARVRKATQLKGELAPGLAQGVRRYLVQADVMALIRGVGGLPPRIAYIVDVRPDATGKWPKLVKTRVIAFAISVPAKPATIRLIAPDAQQPWSEALATRVRDILQQANAPAAPPRVTAVGQAFHVAGTTEGEGETQIFLNAEDGRPLSLSIWRNPGAAPRWAVSLGEIVDESAAPPPRDTLLWYRLACSLPSQLPAASTEALEAGSARIAAEDYAIVIAGLGACQRSREIRNRVRTS